MLYEYTRTYLLNLYDYLLVRVHLLIVHFSACFGNNLYCFKQICYRFQEFQNINLVKSVQYICTVHSLLLG